MEGETVAKVDARLLRWVSRKWHALPWGGNREKISRLLPIALTSRPLLPPPHLPARPASHLLD